MGALGTPFMAKLATQVARSDRLCARGALTQPYASILSHF